MTPTERILSAGLTPKKSQRRTSAVYRWMEDHYEQCKRDWPERDADWSQLAEAFKSTGIMDGSGKPPTPKTVAATWYKVRRKIERQKTRRRPVKPRKEIRREFQRTAR